MERLGALKRNIEKTVAKEKARREIRVKELCEYEDVEQAQEAYAYGYITPREYEAICDALKKGTELAELKTLKSAALEMLADFMNLQSHEIRDFEWELKTPEERERIEKSNAEPRGRMSRRENRWKPKK